jgi:predicted extracellular nuclease
MKQPASRTALTRARTPLALLTIVLFVLVAGAPALAAPPATDLLPSNAIPQTQRSPMLKSPMLKSPMLGPESVTAVFASTSFEEPGTGGKYTDTGDPATDHALVNNAGQAPLNYTSVGGELGFSSYYYNTRGDVGLTDGDYVGVTSYTSDVGAYPDGTQGFELQDTDGKVTVTLDAVSLTGKTNPNVNVQYFVKETGWESDDHIRIWAVVDGGVELDLLNTTGSDIDTLGIEGNWQTVGQNLNGYSTATLKFELDANAANESVYFDNIRFQEGNEAAPTVTSTTPADNATNVALDANITITFSEAVNVSGEWFQIDCPISGLRHVADTAVSGGPTTFTIDPNSDFVAEQCTVTVFAAQVTDQDTDDPPDNMTSDHSWSFTTVGAPPPCSTIPQLQGTGNSSPCQGHRDNIEGCITGVTAKGFYFQDSTGDGNPASSDGIYAYFYKTWNNPSNLQAGDKVRVSGNVTEYYDTTEFAHSGSDNLSVSVIGSCTLPTPVSIVPIADPNADPMTLYERYEGMRVQMSFDGFVVGPTKRFISRYTAGDPEIAFVDHSSSIYGQRIFEDDYPGYRGMNYISGGFDKDLPDVDFGDAITATNLIGVLGYQFDKYTLLLDGGLTQNITVTDDSDSEDAESAAGSEAFTLCTFNIENMFDITDDGDGDMGDWVPADAAEYNRMLEKRAKAIVSNLANCTVIGLEEVEGKDPVWNDLVAAISAQGGTAYSYDYYESIDPRDITTGILYDPSRVTLNASSQEQGCSSTDYGVNYSNADNTYGRAVANPCTAGTYPLYNRPPYLAQLTLKNAGATRTLNVSVIVNHFKSKRGDESKNLPRREAQAQHVVDIMQAEHTAGRTNVVTLGDFNDVLSSTTLAKFNTNVGGNPLVNLYPTHVPANDRYSYIFSGESEVLDHFITTDELDDYFLAGRAVHINADYPDVENMGTDNCTNCVFSAGVTAPQDDTSHRSSDHDPVLTHYSLCRILSAPASLGIALNSGVSGVDLDWDDVSSCDHYEVWDNADPYFVPDPATDTPLAEPVPSAYTHHNSTGSAAVNHFYVITTANPCGDSSTISNRVGEFDFALTPGS